MACLEFWGGRGGGGGGGGIPWQGGGDRGTANQDVMYICAEGDCRKAARPGLKDLVPWEVGGGEHDHRSKVPQSARQRSKNPKKESPRESFPAWSQTDKY